MGINMIRSTLESNEHNKSEIVEMRKDNKYISPKIKSQSIASKGAL